MVQKETKLDPVTFAVLSNAFVNLVDEMYFRLQRSCMSFSLFIGDASSTLCDADGYLVAPGTRDITCHIGVMQPTAQAIIEDFGKENMKPGDVFIFNDPYRGGTHLPDMTIVRPVFWDDEVIAFTLSKGHWTDVGGSTPGSMNVLATECYQEGLVVPPLKVIDAGEPRRDVINLITSNLRLPTESNGDMQAQIEATKTGEQRLLELVQKYGLDAVLASFKEVMDQSERGLISEILSTPEGIWEGDDYIDCDPSQPEKGPWRVHVKMTITHNPPEIVYDFNGTYPPTHSSLNSTSHTSYAAIVGTTKTIFPSPPFNAGFFRPIRVIYPESSCINCPRPVAMCGENAASYEKVAYAIIRCWAQVKPERVYACAFNLDYFLGGGWDNRPGFNKYFVFYHWCNGGWGAMQGLDGRHIAAPTFGPGVTNQSVEVMERQWPIFYEKYSAVQDSMGAGQWRGGAGLEAILRIENEGGALMSYLSDRGARGAGGPFGLFNNKRAIHQGVTKNQGKPNEKYLDVIFAAEYTAKGETMCHVSAGGGGYGDPLDRDPQAVLEDVIDGFVSMEKASEDYGVVIKEIDPDILQYEIDMDATKRLREEMRKSNG